MQWTVASLVAAKRYISTLSTPLSGSERFCGTNSSPRSAVPKESSSKKKRSGVKNSEPAGGGGATGSDVAPVAEASSIETTRMDQMERLLWCGFM